MRSEIDMSVRPTNLNIHPQSAIRIKPPSGRGKSFQLQFKNPDTNKWTTYRSEAIFLINNRLKKGEISYEQAYDRMREEKDLLYKERDKNKPVAVFCSYNEKILNSFMVDNYPQYYKKRIKPHSFTARQSYLRTALSFIPDTPLDTDIEELQDAVDNASKTTYYSNGRQKIESLSIDRHQHKSVVKNLNALLGYMGRKQKLVPFATEHKAINYITEKHFKQLIDQVTDETYRALYGVCFWTGMRFAETLLLTDNDTLNGEILNIDKQWTREQEEHLPKNRKKRRIFLDQEAKYWLKKWCNIPVEERKELQGKRGHLDTMKSAATAIRRRDPNFPNPEILNLYTLRHSRAVYLAGANLSLDMVAKILGNSRSVCERHYAGFILTTEDESLVRQRLGEADKKRQHANKDQQDEIARLKAEIEKLKGA